MRTISRPKLRNALLSSLIITTAHSLKPSQYGNGIPKMTPTSRPYNNNHNNDLNQNLGDGESGGFPADPYENNNSYENSFDQESVEERLASWREQQQQRYEGQNPVDEMNPRDEDGRLKLLATASRGSISVFFFVLMWRSVHHFELADQTFKKSSKRLFLVIPTMILFIGNMAGCVASLSSRTLKAKKRMKAILNLNKLVELVLFLFNIIRLALSTNRLLPREIYVGKSLTNFMFIVQCQLFTRITWDAAQVTQGTTVTPGVVQSGEFNARRIETDGEFLRNEYDYDDVDANSNMRYSKNQAPPYADDNDYWEGHDR